MTGTDEPIIYKSHTGNPYKSFYREVPWSQTAAIFYFLMSPDIPGTTKEVRDGQKKGYDC
jgi:hypothetical protein